MAERILSATVRMSQEEFLAQTSEWSPEKHEAFNLARKTEHILDVGSGVDVPDGPYRTITGPAKVIERFFPD